MPTKKTTQTKTTKKNELTEEQTRLANHILDFFRVSRELLSSDFPEYINQTPEDWKYKAVAKEIAQEMGIDWGNMTYEQNNALMLNMLLEYWAGVEDGKELNPNVAITFPPKK